jgi:homocysteine S-methyltransferase
VDEAVGIVRAAERRGVPVAVSFTVETDGRLPDGAALADAVAEVDRRTGAAAAYFLVNCAHPDHLPGSVVEPGPALERVRGVRANASRQSHAELDESPELDDGDPDEFGHLLARLHQQRGAVSILGGCCGTDRRHVEQVARTLRERG